MIDLMNNRQIAKNWNRFYIMHKDRCVATIYRDGHCTVHYPSFMPYSLYLETDRDLDTRLNNLGNFYNWCSGRLLTLDRKYAKEILNSIGAAQAVTDKDRAMIAITYHGLSLTDVYWIKLYRETITFGDISLYRHSLSRAFADISLRGLSPTLQNDEFTIGEKDYAGDVGTQGVAPKAWIRADDGFYLFKDGDIRDVRAELLASKIIDCFLIDHVSYSADEFEGLAVSKSKIVTSEDISIVSFENVSIYCSNHDKDPIAFVLAKDSYQYYMMNIVDYLVGNTDRHWGNWGFLVNNANNRLIKLYPLMDYNKSFLSYASVEGAKCLTSDRAITQREAALEAVKKVGLNQRADVMPEWFGDAGMMRMFYTRLFILMDAVGIAHPSVDEIAAGYYFGTASSGSSAEPEPVYYGVMTSGEDVAAGFEIGNPPEE